MGGAFYLFFAGLGNKRCTQNLAGGDGGLRRRYHPTTRLGAWRSAGVRRICCCRAPCLCGFRPTGPRWPRGAPAGRAGTRHGGPPCDGLEANGPKETDFVAAGGLFCFLNSLVKEYLAHPHIECFEGIPF